MGFCHPHSPVFSKLANLLMLEEGVSDPKERGGLKAEDKTGCEQEGIESYGQEKSVLRLVKFDTVREQITSLSYA